MAITRVAHTLVICGFWLEDSATGKDAPFATALARRVAKIIAHGLPGIMQTPHRSMAIAIDDILQNLRRDADFMREVSDWQRAPALSAREADWPDTLHPAVIKAYATRDIARPYTHQAQAIAAALRGENTVVVASAAGGKSLCFHAPIAHALLGNPNARALLLFPTKALAQDQLAALNMLVKTTGNGAPSSVFPPPSSVVSAYDGDTPQSKRADIRREARVLVSNADMLHVGILPHHTKWAAFF